MLRASKLGVSTLAILTSLSFVTPHVALAVPPRAGASQTEWQRHFATARQQFEAGQFEDAAASFYQAREAGGPPSLLFNQGLALDRLGRGAAAASSYRRYLAESESAPNRADVEARIAELDTLEADAPTLTMELLTDSPRSETTPPEGSFEQVVVGENRPVIRPRGAEGPQVHEYGPTWTVSWFLLVGTLGAAAGAIGVWVDGENTFSLLREECSVTGCPRDYIDGSSAHTSELVTNVLLVTSGVLGLATIISFIAEGASTSGTDIYVDLSPTGISLRGTF